VPVTVLGRHLPKPTRGKDGYVAQLGAGTAKEKNVSKPARANFAKAKDEPKKKLVEFRVAPENILEVGTELSAAHFIPGQYVDVTANTIGRALPAA
jgi:large subunit ribosomal protein L3